MSTSLDTEIEELNKLLQQKRKEKRALDLCEIRQAIDVLIYHLSTISIVTSVPESSVLTFLTSIRPK